MDIRDALKTKDLTRRSLEEYAEEVFDLHVVALRIQRAAKAGRTTARVPGGYRPLLAVPPLAPTATVSNGVGTPVTSE